MTAYQTAEQLQENRHSIDPQWRYVFDLFADKDPGTLVTFAEVKDALLAGGKPYSRTAVGGLVMRANRELLKQYSRYAASVRGKGYKVVSAEEQVGLAQRSQRRASLALRRGTELVTNIRLLELSPDSQAIVQAMKLAFARQSEINVRLDVRQRRLTEVVERNDKEINRTQVEMDKLRSDMDQLKKVLFGDGKPVVAQSS